MNNMNARKILELISNINSIGLFLLILSNVLFAQTNYQMSGTVKEVHSQQSLEGSVIQATSLTNPSVTGIDTVDVNGYDISMTALSVVDDPHLPGKFSLSQNYPNPYNPSTMIPFSVEKAGRYRLESFNLLGQTIFQTKLDLRPGEYSVPYSGGTAGGIEFVRFSGEGYNAVIKVISPDGGKGIGFGSISVGKSLVGDEIGFLGKTLLNPMDFLVEITGDNVLTYRDTVTLEEGSNLIDFDVLLADYDPFFLDGVPNISFDEDNQGHLDLNPLFEYYGNDTLNISVSGLPAWLSHSVNSGIIAFDPDTNAYGNAEGLIVTITDNDDSISDEFNVLVNSVNDAPVQIADIPNQSVDEGQSAVIALTAHVFDVDNDALSYNVNISSDLWSVSNDTLTITPSNSLEGVIITASDGVESIDLNSFDIGYNLINESPEQTAAISDQTIDEDNQLVLDLTQHVNDPDGDSLSYSVSLADSIWSVSNNVLTVTPVPDWYGSLDSIIVTASDNEYDLDLDPFDLTVNPVNDAPTFSGTIPAQSVDEDSSLVLNVQQYFSDVEGDALSYSASPGNWTDNGDSTISLIPEQDYNGTLENIIVTASDDAASTQSNEFNVVINPMNDAPVFSGVIDDASIDLGDSLTVDLALYFSDVDGDLLDYSINLPDSIHSFTDNSLTITPSEDGTLDNLLITASDGTLSINSNIFSLVTTAPTLYNVHFIMKDYKTDAVLTSGVSTWTIDGVEHTSTDGELDVELVEGSHTFNATNPNTIDGINGVYHSGDFLFLRRPGQTENFEQRSGPDDASPIVIANTDTIIAYKIMSDFNLDGVVRYINSAGNGTVRFGPDDLNAPAWWDLNYDAPLDYIRTYVQYLLETELPSATLGKLNLQYIETTEDQGFPRLSMYMDSSVPGSGTNVTSSDENNNIIHAQAKWPTSPPPGVGDLWIEILQAVGDLPDIAGNPPILSYTTGVGYYINDFGEDIFSLLYFVLPDSYFDG